MNMVVEDMVIEDMAIEDMVIDIPLNLVISKSNQVEVIKYQIKKGCYSYSFLVLSINDSFYLILHFQLLNRDNFFLLLEP